MSGVFSSTLYQKYNVAGPRYTSYPTVPYWDQSPSEEEWVSHLQRRIVHAKSKGTGAAIYIHIPFCQSLCTYCGCNTRITRNRTVGSPYVESVLKEWALYCEKLGISESNKLKLSELHLGGGTPTFLEPEELKALVSGILELCEPTESHEFSLEADPRVTTKDHLAVLANLGFNRLSLGIQDFDPKVQEIVHRVQTEEQVKKVIDDARSLNFESINFDLIYGLPLQTLESVNETVEVVKRLRPDRIAFYAYAHVPWIKASQRRFTEADLPDGASKRALYEAGRTRLEGVGYKEVGMDHFALTTDSLWKASEDGSLHRNFMGYTSRHVDPLIGLGVSSISDAWSAFAQNEKVLEKYQEKVNKGEIPIFRGHVLNPEDLVLRRHVLNIMTTLQTSWLSEELQTEYLEEVAPKLVEFVQDGLLDIGKNAIKVNKKGLPFLRNICMAFDAKLARKAPNTTLFSKTL